MARLSDIGHMWIISVVLIFVFLRSTSSDSVLPHTQVQYDMAFKNNITPVNTFVENHGTISSKTALGNDPSGIRLGVLDFFCQTDCHHTHKKQTSVLKTLKNKIDICLKNDMTKCEKCRCDAQCHVFGDCCACCDTISSDDHYKFNQKYPNLEYRCTDLQIAYQYREMYIAHNQFQDNGLTPKNKTKNQFLSFLAEICFSPRICFSAVISETGVTFCNYACAVFNGVKRFEFLETVKENCSAITDDLLMLVENENCLDEFEFLDSKIRTCQLPLTGKETIISECHNTTLSTSRTVGADIASHCGTYRQYIKYKNDIVFESPHCMMCNIDIDDIECEPDHIYLPDKIESPRIVAGSVSFVDHLAGGLLMLPAVDEIPEVTVHLIPENCTVKDNGMWFDSRKKQCTEVFCPFPSTSNPPHCLTQNETANSTRYTIYMMVLSKDQSTATSFKNDQSEWLHLILHYFNNHINMTFSNEYNFLMGSFERQHKLNEDDFASNINGFNSVTKMPHVFIKLNLKITTKMNKSEAFKKIRVIFNNNWTGFTTDNHSVLLSTKVLAPAKRQVKYFAAFEKKRNDKFCCHPWDLQIAINSFHHSDDSKLFINQATCPYVRLNLSDLYFPDYNTALYVGEHNVTLPRELITVWPDHHLALICLNDLQDVYAKFDRSSETFPNRGFLYFFTIFKDICFVLSFICLVWTLITYATFSQLWSIPGLINVGLSSSLLCSLTVYFIFRFVPLNNSKTICTAVGVFTHFIWLSYILWMHVGSFHMFNTFVINDKPITKSKGRQLFVAYLLYTVVVPALFIVGVITWHLSWTEDIGYGINTCYIDSTEVIIFTFIAPLGLVVISNIVFFIATIREIGNRPQIARSTGPDTHNVVVYIKLSVIAGLWWIMFLLALIPGFKDLAHPTDLLLACQGILLFLSFSCNARCRQLWSLKLKLSYKRPTSSSGRLDSKTIETMQTTVHTTQSK